MRLYLEIESLHIGGATDKKPTYNAEDTRDAGSIPGLGRSAGGGHGNPLHTLAWRIPWIEEPGGLQSIGLQRVDTTKVT